jgi:hypothetical protein
LTGLIIIDEFQRQPDLFPILRVLADRKEKHARFLILGSASPQLMKGASESLAGRVNFIHMGGLNCEEVGSDPRNRLWLRGGFPESYLAASDVVSNRWRRSFVQTFLYHTISNKSYDSMKTEGSGARGQRRSDTLASLPAPDP